MSRSLARVVKATLALVIFGMGCVAATAALWWYGAGSEIGRGVRKEGLLALKSGMSAQDVLNALGTPLYEQSELTAPSLGPGESYWVYGVPGFLGNGFEITVLIKNTELQGAAIEEHDLLIYKCCPAQVTNAPALARIASR